MIRFTYRRWPLKMYEDIEDNGDMRRYTYRRLWHEKTLREDYGARRQCGFVVSFSSLLSHRNHRTVKWGPSELSQSDWCDAQPNPMSFSEDNESKSYPEPDDPALLVAQANLPHVFEIWSWTRASSLVTQGHCGKIRPGYLLAINSPPPTP